MITSKNDSQKKRLNIIISEPLFEWTAETARARGITVSEYIRTALEKELQRSRDAGLADAADRLAGIYEAGCDLTTFTTLDSEEFL